MTWDRLSRALIRIIESATSKYDYSALYLAKVVSVNADAQTVDLAPHNPKLPTMSGIPLSYGGPGETVSLLLGTTILVGWDGGDPSQPYCLGFGGGERVSKRVMNADQIILGGEAGAEPAAKATTLQEYLNEQAAALKAHVHTSGTGPTFPSVELSDLTPPDIAATNVKVK